MEFFCHKSKFSYDIYNDKKNNSSNYLYILKIEKLSFMFIGGLDFEKLKYYFPLLN
jgi:hypothetical protein